MNTTICKNSMTQMFLKIYLRNHVDSKTFMLSLFIVALSLFMVQNNPLISSVVAIKIIVLFFFTNVYCLEHAKFMAWQWPDISVY